MRNAYIVKKSVKRSPLKPKEQIKYEEFKSLVKNSEKLIWLEKKKTYFSMRKKGKFQINLLLYFQKS